MFMLKSTHESEVKRYEARLDNAQKLLEEGDAECQSYFEKWEQTKKSLETITNELIEVRQNLEQANNANKRLEESNEKISNHLKEQRTIWEQEKVNLENLNNVNEIRFRELYASMNTLLRFIKESANHFSINPSFSKALSQKHSDLIFGIIRGTVKSVDDAVGIIEAEEE